MWKTDNGYWRMYVNGKKMYVHRYVWELCNGPIPDGYEVHHGDGKGNFDGDGNKNCNCIANLKLINKADHSSLHHTGKKHRLGKKLTEEHKSRISEASKGNSFALGMKASPDTRAELSKIQRSAGLRGTNTSGFRGVSWFSRNEKWKAQIYANYKQIHLGYFPTPEEAARAYDTAARKYFGDDCFQNFPPR